MKVLIINKFLHPNGGSETYIFKLGEELIRQGHEVQYFGMEHEGRCVGNRVNSYTQDMDFHGGSKLRKMTYPFKIIYSREAARKLTSVLDNFRPDVVHINNFNFQLTPSIIYATKRWSKKNRKEIKIVYTAHDGQLICPNHLMQQYSSGSRCDKCVVGTPWNCAFYKCVHGSRMKSILASLEAVIYRSLKTYRLIDVIVCPSKFLRDKLDNLKELSGRTVVLNNFVDINKKDDVLKENYVLYFGRYSPEKGVDTLLDVCDKLPNVRFVFAGSGPLEERVNKTGNVINKGFLTGKELANTIAAACLTVFPSECNENCPFTVMESISYGVPVIGSRVGGVPELIEDGVNGYTYEPGDSDELYSIIKRLLKNTEELRMITEGARNTAFMSLSEYTKELVKLYQ